MRLFLSVALASLLATVLPGVSASIPATGADARQLLAEQREIREQLERPQGRYSRFDAATQARLKARQERIFALLEPGTALEQMNPREQMELLNAVEEVKAILADNADQRLECWREKKVGSQMSVTRCATVAEREQVREGARAFKAETGVCQRGGGSGPECGPPNTRPSGHN